MYSLATEVNDFDIASVKKALKACYKNNCHFGLSLDKLMDRVGKDLLLFFNGNYGVIIADVREDDFEDPYLFIWGMYSEVKLDLNEVVDSLTSYAKRIKCKYITFGTTRKGWARKLKDVGVEQHHEIVCRKVLDYEKP